MSPLYLDGPGHDGSNGWMKLEHINEVVASSLGTHAMGLLKNPIFAQALAGTIDLDRTTTVKECRAHA